MRGENKLRKGGSGRGKWIKCNCVHCVISPYYCRIKSYSYLVRVGLFGHIGEVTEFPVLTDTWQSQPQRTGVAVLGSGNLGSPSAFSQSHVGVGEGRQK